MLSYARNFYRSLTVTQALGLGVALTCLAGSVAYTPYMAAYNSRIASFVQVRMVAIHQKLGLQEAEIQQDNARITALQSQLHAVRQAVRG